MRSRGRGCGRGWGNQRTKPVLCRASSAHVPVAGPAVEHICACWARHFADVAVSAGCCVQLERMTPRAGLDELRGCCGGEHASKLVLCGARCAHVPVAGAAVEHVRASRAACHTQITPASGCSERLKGVALGTSLDELRCGGSGWNDGWWWCNRRCRRRGWVVWGRVWSGVVCGRRGGRVCGRRVGRGRVRGWVCAWRRGLVRGVGRWRSEEGWGSSADCG